MCAYVGFFFVYPVFNLRLSIFHYLEHSQIFLMFLINFFFYFLFCFWVQSINIAIVSGEWQRNSAIHTLVSIPPPKLPSHPGCHLTLSRVPCAAQ